MNSKSYTLLISSGASGKLRQLRIPAYLIQMASVGVIIGIVGLGVMATTYARMLWKVAKYNDVRNQGQALKAKYNVLKSAVKQSNAKLESLQSLAGQVAIAYGFEGMRRPGFPQRVFDLASQSSSPDGGSYRASLNLYTTLESLPSNSTSDDFLAGLWGTSVPANYPSIWPVQGEITSPFGEREDPFGGGEEFHTGVDIGAALGAPVRSTASGMIIEAGLDAGYGKCILIDNGSGIETRYAHLSRYSVVVGEQVKKGQIIGAVGDTGRSTGPHLHYEVLVHDTPVNPYRFLHHRAILASREPIRQGS